MPRRASRRRRSISAYAWMGVSLLIVVALALPYCALQAPGR
jgi:predicted nucleic acid-binding Zn ribbon protein